MLAPQQTLEERMKEISAALLQLESQLQSSSVKVQIGATGAVAFTGWNDRRKISDACAFRSLTAKNSWALRQAVARAEAMSGRKVNQRAVAAGVHSHDGGRTWHNGH